MVWMTSIEFGAATDCTSTFGSTCRYSFVRGSVRGPNAVPIRRMGFDGWAGGWSRQDQRDKANKATNAALSVRRPDRRQLDMVFRPAFTRMAPRNQGSGVATK